VKPERIGLLFGAVRPLLLGAAFYFSIFLNIPKNIILFLKFCFSLAIIVPMITAAF